MTRSQFDPEVEALLDELIARAERMVQRLNEIEKEVGPFSQDTSDEKCQKGMKRGPGIPRFLAD